MSAAVTLLNVSILAMVWVLATYFIHEDSSLLGCQIISTGKEAHPPKHQQLFVSQNSTTFLKT